MSLTKLDWYECRVLFGEIRVSLSGTNDVLIYDIVADLESSLGRIYLDGKHYTYLGKYEVTTDGFETYLRLFVNEN